MNEETVVIDACAMEGVASVLVRPPNPLVYTVSIQDGCSTEVLLGMDEAETWGQKTGTWDTE